jgi:hypothetical protein
MKNRFFFILNKKMDTQSSNDASPIRHREAMISNNCGLEPFNPTVFNQRREEDQKKRIKELFEIIEEIDEYVNKKLPFTHFGRIQYTTIIDKNMVSNNLIKLEHLMHTVSREDKQLVETFLNTYIYDKDRYADINLKVSIDFNGGVITFGSSNPSSA